MKCPAVLALCALAVSACDPPHKAPAPPREEPHPAAADRAAKVAAARSKTRAHLGRHATRPRKIAEKTCDDSELKRRAPDSAARVLTLATEDARYEAKSLLPLRITNQLTVPRWTDFEDVLAGVGDRGQTPEVIDEAVRGVERESARRFLGVYHVLYYSVPKRIHKLGKRHAEWVAGVLDAWFVIHDAQSLTPLCQAHITVRNDVKDAPLAVRLKSDTRDALVTTLGGELRSASKEALSRMTGVLTMPDDDQRVAHR
ncbi:MAG: hypothetical protein KC776_14565 [Myxococcales bacterium]|nr:hypothetical protein [Myxococcales bacterium]MCB9576062.1 hypothetical protein [Polyangiaceae bacterium]